jgi:hypothetical protein
MPHMSMSDLTISLSKISEEEPGKEMFWLQVKRLITPGEPRHVVLTDRVLSAAEALLELRSAGASDGEVEALFRNARTDFTRGE